MHHFQGKVLKRKDRPLGNTFIHIIFKLRLSSKWRIRVKTKLGTSSLLITCFKEGEEGGHIEGQSQGQTELVVKVIIIPPRSMHAFCERVIVWFQAFSSRFSLILLASLHTVLEKLTVSIVSGQTYTDSTLQNHYVSMQGGSPELYYLDDRLVFSCPCSCLAIRLLQNGVQVFAGHPVEQM